MDMVPGDYIAPGEKKEHRKEMEELEKLEKTGKWGGGPDVPIRKEKKKD